MDKKDKEFMIDMAKHINNCYRKYCYEMTARGLPLGIDSFAKGLDKAIVYMVENRKVEEEKPIGQPIITRLDISPFYRDSVGGEEMGE